MHCGFTRIFDVKKIALHIVIHRDCVKVILGLFIKKEYIKHNRHKEFPTAPSGEKRLVLEKGELFTDLNRPWTVRRG